LAAGVYLAPSAYEVGFLSAAHTDADIEHVGTVFGDVLHSLFAAK
jgi:glutamate-1-semialdehyde aminotransferase